MQVINTESKISLPIKRYFTVGVVLTVLGVCIALIVLNIKQVTIIDEERTINKFTFSSTVEKVLDNNNISLGKWDEVKPSLDTLIEKKQEILVKRAVPVMISADGKDIYLKTCKETVGEAIESAGIEIGEEDIVNTDLSAAIVQNMSIGIVRVIKKELVVTEAIPYKTLNRPNNNMEKGRTVNVQQGSEGEVQKVFTVVLHDGKEVAQDLLDEKVIKEPINKISEYGTIDVFKSSRGETLRYNKVLDMKATAYDLSYESCGKHPDHPLYGITASGMRARKGVVAVDPKVIPLHSRLYIEASDGSWTYGYAVAGDTGGAVKGNKIDLFYDDRGIVKSFGVKSVKVYVLTN
jgi:uncharacterized protein YabE (DUF348 family)